MAHVPVMNNTKWEELRLAMYELGDLSPLWRTRDVENGYQSDWDGEWFYHFRLGGYETIEWVEMKIVSPEQRSAVLSALAAIHVPGELTEHGFRVFGHVPVGKLVEYINAP
ncbi:MAG TPA: DUF6678 family protein [Terriglobia bacterium]|nr:DUF6678 family protein [Terriglobia bacterium]